MKINEIIIKNFGPLKNAKWNIDQESTIILLCGQHGIGKTTFFNGIDRALSQLFTTSFKTIPLPYVDVYSIQIKLIPTCYADEKLLNKQSKYEFPSTTSLWRLTNLIFGPYVPFICIRPSMFSIQHFHAMDTTSHQLHTSRDQKPDLLWINDEQLGRPLDPLLITAITLYYLATYKNEDIEEILNKLNYFLKSAINLELILEGDSLHCKRPDETKFLNATYLSSSEYYAIGLLLAGLILIPPSGIFLVDSPESQLHPSAQITLLQPIMNRLLKSNGQIIIATHSPTLLSTQLNKSIYFLDHNRNIQMPKLAKSAKAINIIKTLYGTKTIDSILTTLTQRNSSKILSYLLECTLSSAVISRRQGDPQIQQLATWLLGYIQNHSGTKLNLVDFGAGNGDLLEAINLSSCSKYINYIPIESNRNLWSVIEERCKKMIDLSYQDPSDNLDQVKHADIVFVINTFHELDLQTRVDLLYKIINLLPLKGIAIIHEVTVLPVGEANFLMWDYEDIENILNDIGVIFKSTKATTLTRPNGWPLMTLCLKFCHNKITKNKIKSSIINYLPNMLNRWTIKLEDETTNNVCSKNNQQCKAFLISQIANICLWKNRYSY
jgi:energy-coupling factor transporter ATP-binding protein EcfA2